MGIIDWLIVLVPLAFVLFMGIYSRRYVRGVADFLAAGRVCGRYVISVADVANALSIIGLVAFVEVHYKTGFALTFWSNMTMPLGIVMGLTGFMTYRFRETKSMSLGQFLEMRYSRSFRIFAAALRSLSEILANMIMPAIAARFFIYFLDLPSKFTCFGIEFQTFTLIVLLVLTIAITLICMGGTLALVITDAIQGMICFPLLVLFVGFIMWKFSWSSEIVPVMIDRVKGESFLNPYDISNLRDFNLFFLVLTLFTTIFHRGSWIGAGNTTAAKSPHEQKMAALLGTWRGALGAIFYVLISIAILTMLNHQDFAKEARTIRLNICNRVANEVVADPIQRDRILSDVATLPEQHHKIGVETPLSQKKNLDTTYFDAVQKTLCKTSKDNDRFQQFRTLYHQLTMAMTMRHMLPMGMLGLFCLLMVLAMVSTDDTRIYSAALTIAQDVVMPLKKKPFTPKQHLWMIRIVSIGVGVIFVFGSSFMSQLDYINLFVTLVCTMWMGGCGPVMLFGLYSRFGTTAGAWTSLLTGMFMSVGGILIQRNWANAVYPWLDANGMVDSVGNFLANISKPLNPYVVWEMDPVKCPVNSYEFYMFTMLVTLFLYCVVSYLTCKEPFNLDRMLHRGIYNLDGEKKEKTPWNLRTIWSKMIGITPEYSTGDKAIAWSFFIYSFVYKFLLAFVLVMIWNAVTPWKIEWWGHYFYVVTLLVPGIVAAISTVWFTIGGFVDLLRLFRDLKLRKENALDNGSVEGNMSLADKHELEQVEREKEVRAAEQEMDKKD